jgi:ABC transporter DrrB family efflux protein
LTRGRWAAFNGLTSIAYKETLYIRRDPATLFFALLIPMIQMSLFGFAINYDVRHIPTVVVDYDHSRESRNYLQSLQNTENLRIIGTRSSPEQAAIAIRRNEARVAVIIPPDFARRWGTANRPQVGVLIDGSDSQVSNPARLAVLQPQPGGPVDARIDVLYNPNATTAIYTIPGLLAVILQLVTVALTAFSLVREREQGTLEQLMVTPVGRLGLMLGKLAPYFVLAMVELLFVVALGHVIFAVPIRGSVVVLMTLAVPFILAGLSIGLVISTIAQNQAQAMQMVQLTLLPSILLAGYIAPRETLPGTLYLMSNLLPATWFIEISRAVMVRGAFLTDLLPQTGYLCMLTCGLLLIAVTRFHKSTV